MYTHLGQSPYFCTGGLVPGVGVEIKVPKDDRTLLHYGIEHGNLIYCIDCEEAGSE